MILRRIGVVIFVAYILLVGCDSRDRVHWGGSAELMARSNGGAFVDVGVFLDGPSAEAALDDEIPSDFRIFFGLPLDANDPVGVIQLFSRDELPPGANELVIWRDGTPMVLSGEVSAGAGGFIFTSGGAYGECRNFEGYRLRSACREEKLLSPAFNGRLLIEWIRGGEALELQIEDFRLQLDVPDFDNEVAIAISAFDNFDAETMTERVLFEQFARNFEVSVADAEYQRITFGRALEDSPRHEVYPDVGVE